jgi:hypothetical protein
VADYDAKIRVSADTRQAESELSKLQKRISQLGDAAFKLDARNFQKSVRDIGTAVQGIGQRGALGALTLAAGKATTALGGLGAKFGIIGAAAASAGATVNSALGGVPSVITDILNHIGQVPNAFGIAAVAAMAFAPQILKASSAATGLAAAVDKAVGAQTTQKIAQAVDSIGQLNVELNATASAFQDLVSGSTLNQLNNQLKDAVKQSGEFHSSTAEAVTAAEQLVTVQKQQRKEQKAINDLIRQAQGLQPQDVRDAELNRRVALLKSREIQQQKDLKLQNQINAELAEYERLAEQVASQTRQWATNLERVARSSKAGVFGTQSQLRTRLQEFQENRRSAELARQRSAELMARERAMAGGQYSLAQVPARGELFPGGRTETAAEQYRSMLNAQARIRAAAADAVAKSERTVLGLQAQTLRTEQQITAAKRQQQSVDERSIQILREQNKLLMEQYRAEQRVASGTLDPASLRADRQRRVEQGRAAQKRRREMTENVIIGGAFPMLFGGGPGAVLGGAAGGLIPGNPMLSVATSAVGALIDSFITSVQEAGSAIRDPITNFQKLADAGLIASRSQKQYIERLIEAGRVTEAAAAIQAELVQKIGAQGIKDLQNAGAASDSFNQKLAELNLQMQAAVAGPLTDLLTWLNNFLAGVTAYNRQQAAQTDFLTALRQANPQAYQQYFKESIQLREANRGVVDPQAIQRLQQRYVQQFNLQPGAVSFSVDKTPELQAKGQTQELAAQVQLEAQKLSLIGMSAEKDAQAYAVIAKRIAQQEYENKLLEIKNSWIGKAFDAERNLLLIRQANLQFAGKLKEIEVELSRASAKAAEDAERQYITRLQAEAALYKQAEQNLLFQVKIGQYVDDQRGGAEALLKNYDAIYKQRLAAFDTEREIALIEAARNGTTQETVQLYTYKLQLLNAEAGLEQAISQLVLDRLELEKKVNLERSRVDAAQPFVELRREQELQLTASQSYLRLVMEGILPAEAERIVNFERLVAQQLQYNADQIKAVEAQIVLTEATITEAQARGAAVDKLKEQLDVLKEQRAVIEGQAAQGPGEGPTDAQRAADALAQVRGELNQLADPINAAVTGANAIGSAFSQAFQGIATGTMTAQEALSSFFKSIGEAFVSMAAEIIAKQLVMITLQTILKALGFAGGGGGGGGGDPLNGVGGADWAKYIKPAADGAYWPGGFKAFADGGLVTKPTMGLIGEGGEPEYVIPQSKMSAAMSRYSRGARGESVIPSSGTSTESAGGTAIATAPIDVRYTVERINSVDYVTADQFQAGMRQAAAQGAKQGEQRALSTLRQNTNVRRSVGI